MNEAGVLVKQDGQWFPMTVRQTLIKGRYAGLAQWAGVDIGDVCPTIIDKDTYEAAHKRLQSLCPGRQQESAIAYRLQDA